MTWLLLAALTLAGVGVWMSRHSQALGQSMMGLGALGLVAVVVLQVRANLLPASSKTENRARMAVSYCLANCLIEDLPGQSGSVLLLFPPRRDLDADAEQSYEEGFTPALRHRHGDLELKAVRLEKGGRDLSAFKSALAQDAEALAVISYAGIPNNFETLFSAGQSNAPLFYVFDANGTANWLDALKNGRIRAAIVPRPGVNAREREGVIGMPETVFERLYLLAAPANADEVAATLKGKR